jgi:hypothetical protein
MHLCFAFAINDPGSFFGKSKSLDNFQTSFTRLLLKLKLGGQYTEFPTYQDVVPAFPVAHVIPSFTMSKYPGYHC